MQAQGSGWPFFLPRRPLFTLSLTGAMDTIMIIMMITMIPLPATIIVIAGAIRRPVTIAITAATIGITDTTDTTAPTDTTGINDPRAPTPGECGSQARRRIRVVAPGRDFQRKPRFSY